MSDRRRPRLSGLPLLLALGLGPACQGPREEREERVIAAVQEGRFAEAAEHARRLAEANPKDAAAQALYRDARVALALDQGRDQVFHGDLTRALELFEGALALAPGNEMVETWIAKTRSQLAVEWLDAAAECTGPEQLDEAEHCYEMVLRYAPHNQNAVRGLAHVLLLKNYRAGMSKTYFDDGLSSFRELMLEQARRAFQISRRYRDNEPAGLRAEQVEKMMAEERLAQARELESAGRYFAARNEYRLVLLIEPEDAEARAGLDRMDRETRAVTAMAGADMKIRRGEYAEAENDLVAARVLSEAQQDHISLLQSGIEDQRHEELYAAAQSLVRDYRYPEAVQAFDALLALAPDYKDAALRKATIEEFIRLTEEFYAKALAASSDDEAEPYLRAIHPIIWPEYKDVVERLQAIEARRAAAGEPPALDEPADDGANEGADDETPDEGSEADSGAEPKAG